MKRLIIVLLLCFVSPVWSDSEETEGGILGTGAAPVGVFGTITKLGSIYVNGVHITYPRTAVVDSPIGSYPAKDLRPGDTVVVEVTVVKGQARAQRITDAPVLIGPVKRGRILGVPVKGGRAYADGDWLLVSGLWSERGLDVTRIRQISPQDFTFVQGDYRPARHRVGKVNIGKVRLTHVRPFETLRVYMDLDGNIKRIQKGLFSPGVTRTLIEGYLTNSLVTGEYTVRGAGIVAYAEGGGQMPTLRNIYCADLGEPFDSLEILGDRPDKAQSCLWGGG